MTFKGLARLVLVLLLIGCAGPKPVLYPNEHYRTVGEDVAKRETTECRKEAKVAGGSPRGGGTAVAGGTAVGAGAGAASGAVGGAIAGSAGLGAAIGAASGAAYGFIGSLFRPSTPNPAYTRFVERCLVERGYEVVGWR